MTTKHTPGREESMRAYADKLARERYCPVCNPPVPHAPGFYRGPFQACATHKAAPLLLEALQAIVDHFGDPETLRSTGWAGDIAAARAAIKAARGEE